MGMRVVIEGTGRDVGDRIVVLENNNRLLNFRNGNIMDTAAIKFFNLFRESDFRIDNEEGPYRERKVTRREFLRQTKEVARRWKSTFLKK